MQLLNSSTVDERNNKNTPNAPPLTFEHQGQDMQEKPAALGGEKSASRTEIMELQQGGLEELRDVGSPGGTWVSARVALDNFRAIAISSSFPNPEDNIAV